MKYKVTHGLYEAHRADFANWPQALEFARNMRKLYKAKPYHTVSIYNTDRADQDSYGLTEAERTEWLGE
jgi:hypothetical protein